MKQEALKQPFFAQFLEAQRTQTSASEASLIEMGITKPWLDMEQTQKFPSDGDEEGGI